MTARTCPQCGSEFESTDRKRLFCSSPCQKGFHDLNRSRGVVALPLLQSWRAGKRAKRGSPKAELSAYAFGQLCALADKWNAEDAAANRKPDLAADKKRGDNWSAADLG